MKFTVHKTIFVAALARCAAIAGSRATMPILANVLLVINNKAVRLAATDLETGYETVVEIEEIEFDLSGVETRITLPAKKLYECCRAIPSSEISISLDLAGLKATISGGTVNFSMSGLDAAEYPEFSEVNGEQINLDAPALVKILESTAYAQSKDASKYHLCGCLIKAEDNTEGEQFLAAVASDGHRLALDSVCLPGEPREMPKDLTRGVIISSKGVAEICKIKTPGVIVISIAGNNLCIATDNEKLYLRLIDGNIINYDAIIPRYLEQRAEVKRFAFIEALERCRIITDKDNKGVRMVFGNGFIELTTDLAIIGGHAEDRVTASVPDGEIIITANLEYILQALQNMECGVVEIHLKDGLAPLLINPIGTEEPMAVIMPMRGA